MKADPLHEPSRLPDPPPLALSIGRMVLRLAVIAIAVVAVSWLMHWAMQREAAVPAEGPLMPGVMLALLAAYACLLAIPFVPGIEIGLMLLMLRGAEIAGFVYLATLAGLFLAFLAGRFFPYELLRRLFLDLRMRRTSQLLDRLAPLSPQERLALLQGRVSGPAARRLIGWRYILLALLVNLPGNGLLGGGGGILMIAGLTRLFTSAAVFLTLALAVAPVPLLVWALGSGALGH